jgi:hypothetical protein
MPQIYLMASFIKGVLNISGSNMTAEKGPG